MIRYPELYIRGRPFIISKLKTKYQVDIIRWLLYFGGLNLSL